MSAQTATAQSGQVNADQLTVPQLQQHKNALEQEVNQLSETLQKLKYAHQGYVQSSKVLEQYEKTPEGSEIIVPLTSCLFVPGKVKNAGRVLLNVGAGYAIEKSSADAQAHCSDKSITIGNNMTKIAKLLAEKKQNLDICMMILQQKLQGSDSKA